MAMENLIGKFRQFEALELALAVAVEEADLDFRGVGGKDRKFAPFPSQSRQAETACLR